MDTIEHLRELNLRVATLEAARERDALAPLLHDALVFRRASGAVVGRDAYLRDLDRIVTTRWVQSVVLDLTLQAEDLAVFRGLVAVDRVQSGSDGAPVTVQGIFLNLRIWTRAADTWQMVGWFNSRAG